MSRVASAISFMKSSRFNLPRAICRNLNSQSPVSSGDDKFGNLQPAQQRDERKRLRRRLQFAPVAVNVFFPDQTFDDRRARRRRAETLLAHRLAQFLVLDQFARAFHRAEQRRFRIARRRFGHVRLDFDLRGLHRFVRLHRHEARRVIGLRLPCHKPPASPAFTITLPSLLNGSPSTRVMRVVTRNSAAG